MINLIILLLQLIGRPMMPPYWALGFQLCRYGYSSSSQDMGSNNNSWVSPPGGSMVWGEMATYNSGGFGVMLNQSR